MTGSKIRTPIQQEVEFGGFGNDSDHNRNFKVEAL